jgi:NAD(P) transhydrogenase
MREYDLVVIGSGPGGQKAAIAAAKLGKTVAAIEHDRMLGACAPTSAPSPSCSGAARVSLAVHLQKRQAVGQNFQSAQQYVSGVRKRRECRCFAE